MNTKLICAIALTVVYSAGCERHQANRQFTDAEIEALQDYILLDSDKPREKWDFTIEFKVNDSEDKLEVTSSNDEDCKAKGKGLGCFKIKKLKTGLITFNFTDESGIWELSRFIICPGGSEDSINADNTCKNDLSLDEQLEFFVMNDTDGSTTLLTPASGQVSLSALPGQPKTFYLRDQNTIKQDYFYIIEACKNDEAKNESDTDKDCLTFIDPPVENKGLK